MRAVARVFVSLFAVAALASAAHAADRVRVGKAVGTAWTFTPIDIGIKEGLFAKYGLDVEIANFTGDAKLQQGLLSNSLEFGLGSGPAMAFAVKGAPILAVAAFANEPRNIAVTVGPDSPITAVADLKGKLLAISTTGSLTEWLVKRISAAEGWGPDGIRRVAIGDAVQQTAALRSGQVDAVMGALENGFQLEEKHEGRVLVGMEKYVPHFVTHVIFARQDLLASNPDEVNRFLKGFFAALNWMKANKAESLAIVQPILNESPAVLDKTYDVEMPMMILDGQFDPQGLELIKDSFVDLGTLPQKPSDDQMLTRQFLPVKP
ncbi:MAG TPA: ABC transporter substrate-binding protein [Stellaceae bacterium]|jgi:NitT/TauT family transport system substrate-binding protein|nr:ABC transporter substrate-binding protein [Stellaceae bacterium]